MHFLRKGNPYKKKNAISKSARYEFRVEAISDA